MTAQARPRLPFRLSFLLVALLLLPGCENQETGHLPEWSPADHTNQGSPSAGQVDTTKKRAGMAELEARGVNDVVLAAWKTNCVRCHGNAGHGDGPEGRMLRPPNMSEPTWQRTRIDSEMKHAIQNGRGRMPAFAELPEKTVEGLVQLVRMLNRDFDASKPGKESGAPAPSGVATAPNDSEKPNEQPPKPPKAELRQ